MANPPGFWSFVITNIGFVIVSCLLTGLSFLAYRMSDGQQSYAIATIGFGCILLGGATELVVIYLFVPDFILTGTEFLYLQASENVLTASGLGFLFYAITRHNTDSSNRPNYASSTDEEDIWMAEDPYDD